MKFKITKHFSLEFLGEEWKECFIDFRPFTVADVKEKLPEIAKLDDGSEHIAEGADALVGLLDAKFIKGKVINEEGQAVDLTKEDLKDLPLEVLGRAFSFLSQAGMTNSSMPSDKS